MEYTYKFQDEEPEFNQVSFDQIGSTSFVHEETVYRSVSILPPQLDHFSTGYISTVESGVLQKPTLSRDNLKVKQPVFIASPSPRSDRKLTPSEMPDILMPNHFDVNQCLDVIACQIDRILGDTNGASFHFDGSKCEWTTVYLCGSSHVKFQIFIYEKGTNEYIVEGNRLMGDGFSFRTIFSQIKAQLTSVTEESRVYTDSFSVSIPIPIPILYEEDGGNQGQQDDLFSTVCFENIFRMAKECTMDAQLEASRMFCDLSYDTAGMQQSMVENGSLTILKDLIDHSVSDWAQQHAMFALANLSEAKTYQRAIIKEGFVPLLVKLAIDGPYHTAEMRRSAVHILANLCDGYSSEVANALTKTHLNAWMCSVDAMSDEKLKIHATRARTYLSKAAEVM